MFLYYKKNKIRSYNTLDYMIFYFYYPAVLLFIFLKYYGYYWANPDFVENILYATIFYLLYIFSKNSKVKSFLKVLSLFIIYTTVFLEFVVVILDYDYYSELNTLILLETNRNEIFEFLRTRIQSIYKIGIILILLVSPFIAKTIIKFRKLTTYIKFQKRTVNKIFVLFFILIAILAFGRYGVDNLLKYNLLYELIYTYNYSVKRIERQKVYMKKTGIFTDAKKQPNNIQERYIVIIGESTTRNHLSLYDYKRETNPLLSKIQKELIVYNNVISPHCQTIKSLEKVLTLGNYEESDMIYAGTIIQLLNAVGFNTYWISNQPEKGKHETLVKKISHPCKEQIFINQQKNNNSYYDEALLVPLNRILSKKEKKQFIFIHLMGTHAAYSNRYPSIFNRFNNNNKNTKQKIVNQYDNAVLYNDYVVYSIINLVKKINDCSFVIYFSDHGEDVFETENKLLMHSESIGTKPMFDIPFIVYFSNKFKENNTQLCVNPKTPYMIDDLIFSISHLLKIKFALNDSTRSIFSKDYNFGRKRIILNNENYDLKFNTTDTN